MRPIARPPLGLIASVLLAIGSARGAAPPPEAPPAQNVTTPKALEAKATFHCIGLKWSLAGDANRNAACGVQFRRKGTTAWRDALALFRVVFRPADMGMNTGETRRADVNALAGSIFHLAPGTAYEVKLSLTDPDGGSEERAIEVATHPLPRDPLQPRMVPVPAGQLQRAIAAAQPGDILLLAPGDHGPGVPINKSGTIDNPIVLRGPADSEAIIRGNVAVSGSHLWFDRLTLDCTNHPAPGAKPDPAAFLRTGAQGKNGLNGAANSAEVFVTRCKFLNHHYGCNVYGHRWFITDCVFLGEHEWHDDFLTLGKVKGHMSGEGVDFHHHPGGVGVVAFCQITGTADGVSYGDNNIDVYNNAIYETCDDLVEMDYGYHNYRVWGNLLYSSLAGLSYQPFNGGPWYVFRNQVSGAGLNILKLKEGYGPNIFANNTLVQAAPYKRYSILLDGIFANNAWVSLPNAPIGSNREGAPFSLSRLRLMDHNAYGVGDRPVWILDKSYSLKDLHEAGVDRHSLAVKGHDVLENLPENPNKGTAKWILPKDGSPLVDGGTPLPNLIESYHGKAPDIGAVERHLGPHWVGPRAYAPSGLAYGLPRAWQVASPAALAAFADIGAPAKARRIALVLTRQAPRAFILATFEPLDGTEAWRRVEELARPEPAEGEAAVRYLDSLVARLATRGPDGQPSARFAAAQWTNGGLWNVIGGCEARHLVALRTEFFLFASSLIETLSVPDPSHMPDF